MFGSDRTPRSMNVIERPLSGLLDCPRNLSGLHTSYPRACPDLLNQKHSLIFSSLLKQFLILWQLMFFWVDRPAIRLVNHCYHHCKLMSSASSNRRDETRARIQEDLMKKRQEFIEAEKERQSKVDFSRYVLSHSSLQLHLTEILFTSKPIALTTYY